MTLTKENDIIGLNRKSDAIIKKLNKIDDFKII